MAALAIAVAIAAPAAAKPRQVRLSASEFIEVHGSASHGFRFRFFTIGSVGAVLWLSKAEGENGEQAATYVATVRGRRKDSSSGHLDVRVGDLGRFRGRFVPTSTKSRQLDEGCSGSPTTEKGHFVGSFSFHGEMGFTAIDTRRLQGSITRQGPTSCLHPDRSESRRHRSAHGRREAEERRQEELRLLAGEADGNLVFSASVAVRSHGLQVDRSASTFEVSEGTETAFQVSDLSELPTEATVAPSAPFSGSATFHLDTPKAASWTGDLTVELPGLGLVPLTGEGISAGLCHGPVHCTRTLPTLLQKELESGSTFFGAVSRPSNAGPPPS
jgi:hypothetical protein